MFWVGSVQAGIRLRLRGPEYSWYQPRGPYHYADLPSTAAGLPVFWHNDGHGGASFRRSPDGTSCVLEAFTGPLTVSTSRPVVLHFDLVVTPNKPLDTAAHFQNQRYYQMESTIVRDTHTHVRVDGGSTWPCAHMPVTFSPPPSTLRSPRRRVAASLASCVHETLSW